ncbi:1172_t:CDS:2, partial [Acaulospora morrowiae]
KEVAFIQAPIQVPVQKASQQAIQTFEIKVQLELGVDYITEEEAKNRISPNAHKPREQIKTWGARLQKHWKELDLGVEPIEANDLDDCKTLFHNLEQYDLEAVRPLTKEELEDSPEAGHEKSEKDLEFREQEELETALKRRAIAINRAKVSKFHPDNGSDVRKMLSQRKQFREILEKEFDKRGQFKFALCLLTKFFIDDKPGNKKQGKKNSRTEIHKS